MYCCLVNSLKQNHKLSILTGSPHVISHEISNPLIKRCLRGAERGRDDSLCHQGASVRVQTAPRRQRAACPAVQAKVVGPCLCTGIY